MDQRTSASLEKALSIFGSGSDVSLDHSVLQLLRSDFFAQYQFFTEQVFFLLDYRTKKYLYVSENVTTVSGFDIDKIYSGGIEYLSEFYHPDDVEKFPFIFRALADKISRLRADEILKCKLSYDYRVRFLNDNGNYNRILQDNIPLVVDDQRNIVYGVIVITNISLFKKTDSINYKVVSYTNEDQPLTILEGVVGKDTIEKISGREKEVIRLTANGLTEKEIADKLSISIQTVKSHRKNLIRRTGVKNSAELIKYCMANLVI
jgi:DNA-binding CsgD family transcriptional regulator